MSLQVERDKRREAQAARGMKIDDKNDPPRVEAPGEPPKKPPDVCSWVACEEGHRRAG